MNDNSGIVFTDSYISATPSDIFLQPGEYAYVNEYLYDSALEDDTVASHMLSFGIDDNYTMYETLPCEATFEVNGSGTYENYILVTLANNMEEMLVDPYIAVGLYDEAGNLMYANGDRASNISILPGSTIIVSISIDNDIMKYYEANGLVAATVDAIAYYEAAN